MKQSWLDRLERKIGRLAIPGLIKYIIILQAVGIILCYTNPILYSYLILDYANILKGEIWRLFTFILVPAPEDLSFNVMSILFLAIKFYLYYMIGNSLENIWGSFKFTMYYLSGYVLTIIAGLIVYIGTGFPWWPVGLEYINQSLFLAFAVIFPNMEFLFYFIIPIKAKWFALLYAGMMIFEIYSYIGQGNFIFAVAIIISLLNFLIFFLSTRNLARYSPKQVKRRKQFKRDTGPKVVPIYRHRCAICGRTEKDNENLEFRFCSKCDGNYEYCADHIYTHEHVRK